MIGYSPPERTNEKGTLLILTAGKSSIKGWSSNFSAGLELRISLATCPYKTQLAPGIETAGPARRYITLFSKTYS